MMTFSARRGIGMYKVKISPCKFHDFSKVGLRPHFEAIQNISCWTTRMSFQVHAICIRIYTYIYIYYIILYIALNLLCVSSN